jgi:hypothetical protein
MLSFCPGEVMTYKELFYILKNMSEEELEQTATVWVNGIDEYFGVSELSLNEDTLNTDVLEPEHTIIRLDI